MDDTTMTATFNPTPEFRKILDELCVPKVEYVVEDPITIEATTEFGETMRYPTAIRERVVRCRDCKHADCYESGLIGPFILCSHFESEGCKSMVEPSGFCAWGERRNE